MATALGYSSTHINVYPPVAVSQRPNPRPMIRTIIDLDPLRPGYTCCGTTKQGRRCGQWMIAGADKAEASKLLDETDHMLQDGISIPTKHLEQLAYLMLCPRWHRVPNQARTAVAQWKRRIQQHNTPSIPTNSQTRAASSQAVSATALTQATVMAAASSVTSASPTTTLAAGDGTSASPEANVSVSVDTPSHGASISVSVNSTSSSTRVTVSLNPTTSTQTARGSHEDESQPQHAQGTPPAEELPAPSVELAGEGNTELPPRSAAPSPEPHVQPEIAEQDTAARPSSPPAPDHQNPATDSPQQSETSTPPSAPPQSSPARTATRKPLEDCPICLDPISSLDDAVYCQRQCGTNFHRACQHQHGMTRIRQRDALEHPDFRSWAERLAAVSCGFCRSAWVFDEDQERCLRESLGGE